MMEHAQGKILNVERRNGVAEVNSGGHTREYIKCGETRLFLFLQHLVPGGRKIKEGKTSLGKINGCPLLFVGTKHRRGLLLFLFSDIMN